MLYYDDGQPIQPYDIVDCDGDLSRVEVIPETPDECAGWAQDEPAVFITSIAEPSDGQFLEAQSHGCWVLIRRGSLQ